MPASAQMPQRLGRRPVLDGMRALAVAAVVGIHVGLLDAGYIGVDVFLPLSGLLITALLCEEWERSGAISLVRFYRRRARRLLPALLLVIAVLTLVLVAFHPFGTAWPLGKVMTTTLLFINNWVAAFAPAHGSLLGALSPTWTLAQEAQFYLLWPPALLILLRRRVSPPTMLALIAAAIVVLVGLSCLIQHADANFNAYASPFNRGAELLLGAGAAIIWRERMTPRALRSPLAAWACVGGLGSLILAAEPSTTFWYMSAALLSTLLVLGLLSGPAATDGATASCRVGAALNVILAARPLAYTGKISYGIYLFHVPIYYLLWTYAPRLTPAAYWSAVLILSAGAAAASWELMESRLLRSSGRHADPQDDWVRLRRQSSRGRRANTMRLSSEIIGPPSRSAV